MLLAAAVLALALKAQGRGAVDGDAVPPGPWPTVCDAVATGWNQTRCQPGHTCCASQYSGSLVGCCPFAEATCCSNRLTCCPKGTTCQDEKPQGWPGWAVVTTCVPTDADRRAQVPPSEALVPRGKSRAGNGVPGKCVCKPGPSQPMDPTRKNILVIGDSVSIGYTPHIASLMADKALVQHAPWGGDGGAEETAYGLQCIDYFTRAPNGEKYTADVVMFNWGLVSKRRWFMLLGFLLRCRLKRMRRRPSAA